MQKPEFTVNTSASPSKTRSGTTGQFNICMRKEGKPMNLHTEKVSRLGITHARTRTHTHTHIQSHTLTRLNGTSCADSGGAASSVSVLFPQVFCDANNLRCRKSCSGSFPLQSTLYCPVPQVPQLWLCLPQSSHYQPAWEPDHLSLSLSLSFFSPLSLSLSLHSTVER